MTLEEIEQMRLKIRPEMTPEDFLNFVRWNFKKRAIAVPPNGNWDDYIPSHEPPPVDQPPPPPGRPDRPK